MGDLVVDLLTQADIWIDANGREHKVADMHPAYIARVVGYLQDHAEAIETLWSVGEVLAFDGTPDSAAAMKEALDERRREPLPWLRSLPLMQAFRARLIEGGVNPPW